LICGAPAEPGTVAAPARLPLIPVRVDGKAARGAAGQDGLVPICWPAARARSISQAPATAPEAAASAARPAPGSHWQWHNQARRSSGA